MKKNNRIIIAAVLLLACLALVSQLVPAQEPPQADLPLLTPAQHEQSPEAPIPAETTEPWQTASLAAGTELPSPEITQTPYIPSSAPESAPSEAPIPEDGSYDSKDEVALYIHTYGRLPSNYITKSQARALGWDGGSVEKYAPGKCIGGDHFGNYENILPDGNYTECDIDTLGYHSRGSRRIVFSDDGRIYYTHDHYESFEQLY